MKTFFNYLFVLCLFIGTYGCSDDSDAVICTYPSFECENAKGCLIYDTENKRWEIHLAPDDETLVSSPKKDGFEAIFLIKNMKEEYESLEGSVIFSGTFSHLYNDVDYIGDTYRCIFFYTLHIKDIQKREKTEDFG